MSMALNMTLSEECHGCGTLELILNSPHFIDLTAGALNPKLDPERESEMEIF